MKTKPFLIMEGNNYGSEYANILEQSHGMVQNFIGESCMY